MSCVPNPYLPGSLHGLLEVLHSRSPSPDMAQTPDEPSESTESESGATGIVVRRRTYRRMVSRPRLTTTDSALIRFLLSNGVSRADIHNNLGWSSSTIIAHGSQKNKGALDQKLVNAKFYEILDKARYSRPNMPGTNRWVQINARENGGTDSGSVARKIKVHGRMGRQSNKAFPYQGSRSSRRTEERLVSSSPSSTTSSRASALAPHSSTHDDKFLRAFVTRAKLDKECIGMLKAAGLTTAAKLSAAAEMPHPVMEQFVATCLT